MYEVSSDEGKDDDSEVEVKVVSAKSLITTNSSRSGTEAE
jgi:hypothetical protein